MVTAVRFHGSRPAMALAPLACILFTLLYAIAASQDPEYTFLENYLSDLGVGPGAWAFNSALLASGAMLSLFAVFGLSAALPTEPISRTGGALLALAGVFLVNVGIFTEDAGDIHLILSYAFFISAFFSLGVLTIAMYRDRCLGSVPLYVTGGLFLSGLIMILALGVNPFTETLAVLMVMGWGIVAPVSILAKFDG